MDKAVCVYGRAANRSYARRWLAAYVSKHSIECGDYLLVSFYVSDEDCLVEFETCRCVVVKIPYPYLYWEPIFYSQSLYNAVIHGARRFDVSGVVDYTIDFDTELGYRVGEIYE